MAWLLGGQVGEPRWHSISLGVGSHSSLGPMLVSNLSIVAMHTHCRCGEHGHPWATTVSRLNTTFGAEHHVAF